MMSIMSSDDNLKDSSLVLPTLLLVLHALEVDRYLYYIPVNLAAGSKGLLSSL